MVFAFFVQFLSFLLFFAYILCANFHAQSFVSAIFFLAFSISATWVAEWCPTTWVAERDEPIHILILILLLVLIFILILLLRYLGT